MRRQERFNRKKKNSWKKYFSWMYIAIVGMLLLFVGYYGCATFSRADSIVKVTHPTTKTVSVGGKEKYGKRDIRNDAQVEITKGGKDTRKVPSSVVISKNNSSTNGSNGSLGDVDNDGNIAIAKVLADGFNSNVDKTFKETVQDKGDIFYSQKQKNGKTLYQVWSDTNEYDPATFEIVKEGNISRILYFDQDGNQIASRNIDQLNTANYQSIANRSITPNN